MTTPQEAVTAIETALRAIPGLRYYPDLSAPVDPPATLLGPPELEWQAVCQEPTTARCAVYVVVAQTDRASEALLEHVPVVAAALDAVPDTVVVRARPGSFGGSDLPSYEITTEVSL